MKKKNCIKIAKDVIITEIKGLKKLQKSLDKNFNMAVEKIVRTTKKNGKICFIGLGKSGAIAERASKTFSSVNTPSLYISASEFSHGDSGVLQNTDLIIIASSSGETQELKNCITFAKRWGIYLIGVCQKKNSTLYKSADIKIFIPSAAEAGLSMLPTTSLSMFSALFDALAVAILKEKRFDLKDYKKLHPGGTIGASLLTVSDLYISDKKKLPLINENKSMSEGIKIMSAKKFGTLIVLDSKKRLKGTYSDGDSRRDAGKNFKNLKVKDLMKKKPITIEKNVLAVNCLRLMQNNKITKVIVAKKDHIEGLISIHHIIDSGIK